MHVVANKFIHTIPYFLYIEISKKCTKLFIN